MPSRNEKNHPAPDIPIEAAARLAVVEATLRVVQAAMNEVLARQTSSPLQLRCKARSR